MTPAHVSLLLQFGGILLTLAIFILGGIYRELRCINTNFAKLSTVVATNETKLESMQKTIDKLPCQAAKVCAGGN